MVTKRTTRTRTRTATTTTQRDDGTEALSGKVGQSIELCGGGGGGGAGVTVVSHPRSRVCVGG